MKIDSTNIFLFGGIGIVSMIIYIILKKNSSIDDRSLITLKDPSIKYSLKLIDKEKINWNTYRFRFELPSSKHILGFRVGQFIYLSSRIDGEFVKRPYTPISFDDQRGFFDLLIKIYPNGKMTKYLSKLPLGHSIDVSGPDGQLIYHGNGLIQLNHIQKRIRQLILIAGGSGLTPMFQLMKKIEAKQFEEIYPEEIYLLFANRTEEDILLRDQLELIVQSNPNRFHLWFLVDQTSNENWIYSQGYFNENIFRDHLPAPSDQILICLAGPTQMIQSSCLKHLYQLGYSSSMIHLF